MKDLFGNSDGIDHLVPILKGDCDTLQDELELPINGLGVDTTIGTGIDTKGQMITITANILECDCPFAKEKMSNDHYTRTKAFSVSRAKVKMSLMIDVEVSNKIDKNIIPTDAIELKVGEKSATYRLSAFSNAIAPIAEAAIRYAVDHYVSQHPQYGCCHLYQACSDKKRCVSSNRFYATACRYKENLDKGLIFYGVNRNV